MGGHIEKLGKSLGKSVESYNQAVASLETRVMVKALRAPNVRGRWARCNCGAWWRWLGWWTIAILRSSNR